jgi:hypothetical protein
VVATYEPADPRRLRSTVMWRALGGEAALANVAHVTTPGMERALFLHGTRLTVISRASMPALKDLRLRGQWWEQVSEVEALPQFRQLERLYVETTRPELWMWLTKKIARVELQPVGKPLQVFAR